MTSMVYPSASPVALRYYMSKRLEIADRWIDIDTGIVRRKQMGISNNSKRFNLLETVYGCGTNGMHCPWGCNAKFTFKKVLPDARARFDIPVPQILDEKSLLKDFIKLKNRFRKLEHLQKRKENRAPFFSIGSMGDPSYFWSGPDGDECTVGACEIGWKSRVYPVVFTRFWKLPTPDERTRLYESNAVINSTISALDSDTFLRPRLHEARRYLSLGGKWVQRVVTFYFDDTTQEGRRLWRRQDELMKGRIPGVSDNNAIVIENPARLMKGTKEWNPLWDNEVPQWAYFKAPTLKDHRYSPHNHNWTASPLYQSRFSPVVTKACWEGSCLTCTIDCGVASSTPKQTTLESSIGQL